MMANAYARAPREGWHTATVLTVVFGGLAILFSAISLVGLYFAFWALEATIFATVCGFVRNKTWRAVCAGLALLSFLGFAVFAFFWGVLTAWVFGLGLLLMVGSLAGWGAAICCIVELIRSINGQDAAERQGYGFGSGYQQQPQIVINNNAQVGNNDNRRLAVSNVAPAPGVSARMGVIDAGRPGREVSVSHGQRFVIGRDASADIRLSDPKVSRRHVEVRLDGGLWVVQDLGATNPASLMGVGPVRLLRSDAAARLPHGQISIGDSVITLYPVGRM